MTEWEALRQLGMSPAMWRQLEEAGRLVGNHEALMRPVAKGLKGPGSGSHAMELALASGLVPAYLRLDGRSAELQRLAGVMPSPEVSRLLAEFAGGTRYDALAAFSGMSDQLRNAGLSNQLERLRSFEHVLGLDAQEHLRSFMREQGALIDSARFRDLLDLIGTSIPPAQLDEWPVPAWRYNFELLANASLARDIGQWERSERRPADPGDEFAEERRIQGEDDAASLELILRRFPSLRTPFEGARASLAQRQPDFRRHFGASGRKLVHSVLDLVAPIADVTVWVREDPRAPARKQPGKDQVSFKDRIHFAFQRAAQAPRVPSEAARRQPPRRPEGGHERRCREPLEL